MNPIINKLNPLGRTLSMLNNLKSSGSPEEIFQNMIQTNPQFRSFVDANSGKSPHQIAQENGIDLDQILSLLK